MELATRVRRRAFLHNAKDRFLAKVKTFPSGCWIRSGTFWDYGTFVFEKGRAAPSNRAAWTLFRGEIPAGLWVLHKCAVKGCVNPDHLYLGTPSDNGKDRWAQGVRAGGVWRWESRSRGRYLRKRIKCPAWVENREALDAFLNSPPPDWLVNDKRGRP